MVERERAWSFAKPGRVKVMVRKGCLCNSQDFSGRFGCLPIGFAQVDGLTGCTRIGRAGGTCLPLGAWNSGEVGTFDAACLDAGRGCNGRDLGLVLRDEAAPTAFDAVLGLPDRADVRQSGLSSILQGGMLCLGTVL